ncbi:MAG: glycosyltransferase [Bacteroidia bacterium]
MISIVICHRNKPYLQKIKDNIESTIGVPYELQIIDNSNGQYTIFEAYNLGVSKSQYAIICFTHEDILFHTENWGQKVVEHFKDKSIGMIGVIGGNVFPKSPSPWWSNSMLNDHLVNNIQHWNGNISNTHYNQLISRNANEIITRQYNNPTRQNVVDAIVLDGLWFCIRKGLFDIGDIKFDESTFKGFHCYDSDISLQVKQYARVCVVYDILIEHFQQGSINRSWFESVLSLNRKWRDKLPIFAKKNDESKYPLYEWETLRTFVYWMESNGYTEHEIKQLIAEIYPLLQIDKPSKFIASELINRAKFGKNISRIINKLKIIIA